MGNRGTRLEPSAMFALVIGVSASDCLLTQISTGSRRMNSASQFRIQYVTMRRRYILRRSSMETGRFSNGGQHSTAKPPSTTTGQLSSLIRSRNGWNRYVLILQDK